MNVGIHQRSYIEEWAQLKITCIFSYWFPLSLCIFIADEKSEILTFSIFVVHFLTSRILDAFEAQIGSAVENAITQKLGEGVSKLDSFLQALPKEIEVDDTASLNVTFVNDLSLRNSSIGLEINGLFIRNGKDAGPKNYIKTSLPSDSCTGPKMLGISLDEAVFNSASDLYYNVRAKFCACH